MDADLSAAQTAALQRKRCPPMGGNRKQGKRQKRKKKGVWGGNANTDSINVFFTILHIHQLFQCKGLLPSHQRPGPLHAFVLPQGQDILGSPLPPSLHQDWQNARCHNLQVWR